jgi:hypothetical protein
MDGLVSLFEGSPIFEEQWGNRTSNHAVIHSSNRELEADNFWRPWRSDLWVLKIECWGDRFNLVFWENNTNWETQKKMLFVERDDHASVRYWTIVSLPKDLWHHQLFRCHNHQARHRGCSSGSSILKSRGWGKRSITSNNPEIGFVVTMRMGGRHQSVLTTTPSRDIQMISPQFSEEVDVNGHGL